MSAQDLSFYRKKINQMGRWTGARWLRNKGISFEQAYFILFNRQPKAI